jgi:hypothetical protein
MEKMMTKNLKLWAGVGVVLIAAQLQSTSMLAAAGEAGETATVAQADNGQGEYIAALGLIDAYVHLSAKLNNREAQTRAKKLALELTPTLKKHKAFLPATSLGKLKTAQAAILAARGTGEDVSAHNMVSAVLSLVQNANTEFTTGAMGRKLQGLSAAQKAWGMVQAAKSIMADITPQEREEHTAPLAEIDAALVSIQPLWPDLKRDQLSKADPHLLAVAVAKIEFAAAAIK